MDLRSSVGCPRRFTSLWIGTTTKVRLAVVPLSDGCWSVRNTLRCKHTRRIRKVETETFAALTASGRSPEETEKSGGGALQGLAGPTTTVLQGRNERTGSSGNVWRNWGYLAGHRRRRKTDGVNQQGVGVRRRNILAPRQFQSNPSLEIRSLSPSVCW
jgi:hypothetical protein